MSDEPTLADRLREDCATTQWLLGLIDGACGECHRCEAAARIAELEVAIRDHRDAGIEDNCGRMDCEKGCGHDLRLWALIDGGTDE